MDPQGVFRSIVLSELAEIDQEMEETDNSDIVEVVSFHINHSIRDIEQRITTQEETELPFPHNIDEGMKIFLNTRLLYAERLLRYYYRACYFGPEEERLKLRREIESLCC